MTATPPPGSPSRRDVMISTGAVALGGLTAAAFAQRTSPVAADAAPSDPKAMGWDPEKREYVLPPLPYAYDALEPHIDAETMRIHHDMHHAGYVRGLNTAVAKLGQIRNGDLPPSEIKSWSRQLAFNGSGHLLHVMFWNSMSPDGGGRPGGELAERINRDFGSFADFALQFQAAAGAVEGSGWGLLVLEPTSDRLMVMQAEKHQNLTAWGVKPLLGIDVWEHAYYLKYQNRRKAYVDAFMNVVNWDWAAQQL